MGARTTLRGSAPGATSRQASRRLRQRRQRSPGQPRQGQGAAPRARHVGARVLPAVSVREGRLGEGLLEDRELGGRRRALPLRRYTRPGAVSDAGARLGSPKRSGPDEGAAHELVAILEWIGSRRRPSVVARDELLGRRRRNGEIVVADDAGRRRRWGGGGGAGG